MKPLLFVLRTISSERGLKLYGSYTRGRGPELRLARRLAGIVPRAGGLHKHLTTGAHSQLFESNGEQIRLLDQRRQHDNPNFFVSLAATGQGRFLPQPGAVLIGDQGCTLLGAAGASGGTGDQDEMCCAFGVTQAGLVTDTST